jgi:SMODS and SLOG-associating 2TM effector domain 1
MSERDEEFLRCYQAHRFEDQLRWYEGRISEFNRARGQVNWLSWLVLVATAAAAFAGGADLEHKALWSTAATVLPAIATMLAAYDGLYSFERIAKLYQDATDAMGVARADSPAVRHVPPEHSVAALTNYVNEIEAVFRKEQGQWGQLTKEPPPKESANA